MEDERVFRALADPTRRLLLDRLYAREGRTLTELDAELEMTRFGVMKHLRVLEDAGLVVTRKVGREKLHYLNAVPIRLVHDRWIDKYTAPRAGALAALKAQLEGDGMNVETPTTTAARPRHVYQVYIKASAEQIWDAITKPEFTSRYFFGTRVESTLDEGSPFVYRSADGSDVAVDGQVLESDPPQKLVHTWRALYDPEVAADAPSRVTWEIEPVEDGVCKLTTVHDQFEGETATFRSVADGWNVVLSSLKTLLETGQPLQERAS